MTAALRHHSSKRATSAHPPVYNVLGMGEWQALRHVPRVGLWHRIVRRFADKTQNSA